jgi:hypothetical protein
MIDANQSFEEEKIEYSLSDKFAGIFYEPSLVYANVSSFPLKNSDWFLPLLLSIMLTILAYIVYYSNPVIKTIIVEKQIQQVSSNFQKMIEEGKLTQEQAEEQIEKIRNYFDSPLNLVITIGAITVNFFIFFFIVATFYYVILKLFFGYSNSYRSTMIAYGLSYYIYAIYSLAVFIASLIREDVLLSLSLASILNIDKNTIYGLILNIIDPVYIWQLIVMGLGFSILSNSQRKKAILYVPLASWIIYKIAIFYLAKYFDFFKNLNI